ncbi:hypothetical protein Patl1_06573 [Pistacia atlantica]|uniref:Uncharacterized protein n=1 Tax=Pistacia atlantica TaxID=434234 RepID=A0ACC1BT91_9ROSI|nr:hypothetical protein Patl1_06573 [Pistacia atlantica]
MITGKRPTDHIFEGGLNLHNFVRMALPDRLMEIVDPMLLNSDDDEADTNYRLIQQRNNIRKECLVPMARIGVACSMESPPDRMNITDVVHELQLVRNFLLQPRTVFD